MTDTELLSTAIKASGLSARRFAVEVLVRDPRTLFRWLSGSNPLPQAVRAHLEKLVRAAEAKAADPYWKPIGEYEDFPSG